MEAGVSTVLNTSCLTRLPTYEIIVLAPRPKSKIFHFTGTQQMFWFQASTMFLCDGGPKNVFYWLNGQRIEFWSKVVLKLLKLVRLVDFWSGPTLVCEKLPN